MESDALPDVLDDGYRRLRVEYFRKREPQVVGRVGSWVRVAIRMLRRNSEEEFLAVLPSEMRELCSDDEWCAMQEQIKEAQKETDQNSSLYISYQLGARGTIYPLLTRFRHLPTQ